MLLLSRASPKVRYLDACWSADGERARAELAARPNLMNELDDEDRRVINHAAWWYRPAAVRLMLSSASTRMWGRASVDRARPGMLPRLCRHRRRPCWRTTNPPLTVENEFGGTPIGTCIYGCDERLGHRPPARSRADSHPAAGGWRAPGPDDHSDGKRRDRWRPARLVPASRRRLEGTKLSRCARLFVRHEPLFRLRRRAGGRCGARAKPGIRRSTTFSGSSTQASVMKSTCLTSSVAATNVTLPRARLAGSAFWKDMPRSVSMRCSVVFSSRADLPGADEKGRRALGEPVREFVVLAERRVEQHDAAQAIVGAAGRAGRTPPGCSRRCRPRSRPARRGTRRARARRRRARSGVRPLPAGIARNTSGSQNRPALESSAFTANCGATSTALSPDSVTCRGTSWRLRTSRASVASLPWKNTTMSAGRRGSKPLGMCSRTRAVAVGLVFPVGAAARGIVAAPLAVEHVEERTVLLRHIAAIGERRDLERHQCGLRRRQRRKLASGRGGGHGGLA